MHFQAAYSYMKRGHAIALPEWGGYWSWDDERKTVLMHTRKGEVIDMRDSKDMDYTLSFTFRDDWEIVAQPDATEHHQAHGTSAPLPKCGVCGTRHVSLGRCTTKDPYLGEA